MPPHVMGWQGNVHQALHGSLDAAVVENDLLRLTVVPELGGKIVSLIRRQSGREYLLQPREPERGYKKRFYGDRFENYDVNGFDECVPTVAECLYPEEPFLARPLPDHGDIWCLPSAIDTARGQISSTTLLRSLPLRFTKTIRLLGNTVRLDYEATNLGPSTVKFLWSAHPLLKVDPGAEIVLPKEVEEVDVGWSKDERLGKAGDRCTWPQTADCSGQTVELNRVASPSAGTAEKLFTPRLSEGLCGILLEANESIAFRFDPRLVPYVGIWQCHGGWPATAASKQFTVALEPCNGRPDSLEEAITRNECATLPGYGTMQWWMEIEVNGSARQSLWETA
jgi:hypothetical protein